MRSIIEARVCHFDTPSPLKGDWDKHFKDDVSAHVKHTLLTCYVVHVCVLQSAQMVLIGAVQQILSRNTYFCHFLFMDVQVRTERYCEVKSSPRSACQLYSGFRSGLPSS